MRRVNVRNGLKQRINDILGSDTTTDINAPGLTDWSIQAAMLNNFRRLGKAIVGDSVYGRCAKGLDLTYANGSFSISSGIGITPDGDAVVLNNNVKKPVNSTGNFYFFVKHVLSVVDGNVAGSGGKETDFVSKGGKENIVYDDLASTIAGDLSVANYNSIIIIKLSLTASNDAVYVGSIVDGVLTKTIHRGFPVNRDVVATTIECSGQASVGAAVVNQGLTLRNGIILPDDGPSNLWPTGYSGTINPTQYTNLIFKDGILIDTNEDA